ncbi:MAG: 50S ribosomal protein L9 [Deltaproteobacteria bacterium]|nr:50S ribosomal protein L9 [Sandaracinaceae bacterium]MCX7807297.1 50S ribosomal protein L9 [Deltaproteobacteria bacterium]
MASYVQVILQENIEKLGQSGDVVRVRPGYARNYLVPRGLALLATKGNLARIEQQKQAALARANRLRSEAESLAKRIEEAVVEIPMPVGEGGRLFGSVGTKDIAEGLRRQGIDVDRKKLVLSEPIKSLGEYEAQAKLGQGVVAKIKVRVVPASSPQQGSARQ